MNRSLPIAILVLVLIAGGGWFLTHGDTRSTALPPGALEASETTEAEGAEAEAVMVEEMVLGEADAPLTVVEYASYTCPHCANFHNTAFKDLKAEYIDTGKVRFVYREVYFDRFGLWASMVARCGGQARFFGITDLMYKSQAEWVRAGEAPAIVDELRKIGRLAGLDNDQLEACLQDGDKAQALVNWYEKNAKEDDIRSTPTFLIDGKSYSNMPWDEFKSVLDEKLGDA